MADVRSDLGKALADWLTPEQAAKLMDEVLATTKQGWGYCKTCRKSVSAEVPDAKAVTGALVDLANQAWGRPSEDAKVPEGISFVRKVVFSGVADG